MWYKLEQWCIFLSVGVVLMNVSLPFQKKIMMLLCGTIVCGLLTYMGGKYMGFWGS